MSDVFLETLPDSVYAMYIAIAPRDPRDYGIDAQAGLSFLEPVAMSELIEALLERNVPAQVIDGAHVGAPGWLIARTLGIDDGVAPRWAPDENNTQRRFPTISFEDLASSLAQQFNTSCHVADHPSIPSSHAHLDGIIVDINKRASALIGKFRSTDGPLIAHAVGDDIWFAHDSSWSVVTSDYPDANLEAIFGWTTSYPAVYVERNGAWRRMTVISNNYFGVHEWGPEWTNVDPRTVSGQHLLDVLRFDELDPVQLVFDYFEEPTLESAEISELFNLDQVNRSRLELVLNSPEMDDPLSAVLRILDAPVEAAEVAEGWRDPSELENSIEYVHEQFSKAMWSSATTVPTEPDVSSRLMRLWLSRPPAYYVLNVAEVVALGAVSLLAARKGRKKTATIFGVASALAAVDFLIPARWRGQNKDDE